MSSLHALPGRIRDRIMGQVAAIWICASQQSASRTHQVGNAHIGSERITSRPRHISSYVHVCWRNLFRLAMHQDPIARLDQNIIQRICSECVAQVDAKYSCGPVWLPAE